MGFISRLKIAADCQLTNSLSFFSWLNSGRKRHRVVGTSMEPNFFDGDLVFTSPVDLATLEAGDVVVAKKDNHHWIKRVSSFGNNTVALSSDSPLDSKDSRHVGSFTGEQLLGRAFAVFTSDGTFRWVQKKL